VRKKKNKKTGVNMSKAFIIDTNVLLHDPKAIFSFQDNEVIIPLVVLDELDKIKTGQDETARNARMVVRTLDEMRFSGNLSKGIKTKNGGEIRIELNNSDNIPYDLDKDRVDNRIISVALNLSKSFQKKVIVVSKDINLRVKCDALGVMAEDYNSESIVDDVSEIYAGWAEFNTTTENIDALYDGQELSTELITTNLHENQYLLLRSETEHKHSFLAKVKGDILKRVNAHNNIWGISPRNKEQVFALDALFDPDIKLVTLMGTAGTGKTMISIVAGISQLLDSNTYKKVLISRLTQSVGKDLGFLPGTKDEKLEPYIAPFNDNLELIFSDKGKGFLEMQKESGRIEVEAIQYMRGRSINNAFMIIDECQNLSLHEGKTLLTRAGADTKIVLIGDIDQIDTPYLGPTDNFLSHAVEKFKGHKIAAQIKLVKGERSELATLAAKIL
jgi:PhoH-like ATPase